MFAIIFLLSVNPAYRMRLGMALAAAGDRVSARRELETSLQKSAALRYTSDPADEKLLAKLETKIRRLRDGG